METSDHQILYYKKSLYVGFYCPATERIPIPCPMGTYGHQTGLEAGSGANGCAPCPEGFHCWQGRSFESSWNFLDFVIALSKILINDGKI